MQTINELHCDVEEKRISTADAIHIPSRYEQYQNDLKSRVEIVLPLRYLDSTGAKVLSYQAAIKLMTELRCKITGLSRSPLLAYDLESDIKNVKCIVRTLYSKTVLIAFHNTKEMIPFHLKDLSNIESCSFDSVSPRLLTMIEQARSIGPDSLFYESCKRANGKPMPNVVEQIHMNLTTRTAYDAGNTGTPIVLQVFPNVTDINTIIKYCLDNGIRCDIKPIKVTENRYKPLAGIKFPMPLQAVNNDGFTGSPIFSFGMYN